MKYALFAPTEPSHTGFRVVQVADETFEVALPLEWTLCDNAAQADSWFFDPTDSIVKPIPQLQTV